MLKTLFFSMLLHLGWADQQAPWVHRVDPRELIQAAQLVQTASRAAQVPLDIPEALGKAQGGFPGPIWKQAAKTHGVDPVLLYSDALFESGRHGDKNKVGPWPFALNFNEANVSIYALSAKEARFVLANVTTDNVDIGLGQVNYKSHKDKVQRPEDLLDPKINLTVASKILAEALNSTPDPELGVGRYHSWTEWRARAYGRKVLTIFRALKGFVERQEAASERQPTHGSHG
jgi:hypothetical protein